MYRLLHGKKKQAVSLIMGCIFISVVTVGFLSFAQSNSAFTFTALTREEIREQGAQYAVKRVNGSRNALR